MCRGPSLQAAARSGTSTPACRCACPTPGRRRPAERRVLLRRAACDYEVLVNDGRRAEAVASRQPAQDLGRVEVDDALVAECLVGQAGLRVERIEFGVARPEDDWGGVLPLPPQYSTPRVEGLPVGSRYTQILFRSTGPAPRRGSTASRGTCRRRSRLASPGSRRILYRHGRDHGRGRPRAAACHRPARRGPESRLARWRGPPSPGASCGTPRRP